MVVELGDSIWPGGDAERPASPQGTDGKPAAFFPGGQRKRQPRESEDVRTQRLNLLKNCDERHVKLTILTLLNVQH
jgi:hypothetical protein